MNIYKITIYDPFFKLTLSGEFRGCCLRKAKEACKKFYAHELDTTPEEVEKMIIKTSLQRKEV